MWLVGSGRVDLADLWCYYSCFLILVPYCCVANRGNILSIMPFNFGIDLIGGRTRFDGLLLR